MYECSNTNLKENVIRRYLPAMKTFILYLQINRQINTDIIGELSYT